MEDRDERDWFLKEGFSIEEKISEVDDAMVLFVETCMLLSPFYYSPSFGTLLGLYRDGGFIPHDTDHDFNIYCKNPSHTKILRRDIENIFLENGYETILRDTYQLVLRKINGSQLLIDLCFFYKDGDEWLCPHQIKLFRLPYKASHDPIVFLEAIYGDWETPRMKDEPYLA